MAEPKLTDHPKGHPLYAICNDCRHSAEIQVEAVIDRLGTEATYARLRQRLKCSWCGGRDVKTIVGSSWG